MLVVATLSSAVASAQPAAPAPAPAAKPAAPAAPGAAKPAGAPGAPAAGQPVAKPATPGGQRPATAVNPLTNDLAKRAIETAAKENYDEASNLFREAYRIDKNPRWLYNMGVLYDRMANCDDAAFFYRAGLFGGGVLPQDREAVDNRLNVLQEECKFKERHKLISDRHDRATRYIGLKLCALAEDILTGIITPAERKLVDDCKAEVGKTMPK
jgi:tetratricopeptide (TPR) repeat protein